jgi:hypothetical protein
MRIALAVMATAGALILSSCKVISTSPASEEAKPPADQKEVICTVARAWISADPAVKSQIGVSLSASVRKAEQFIPEANRSEELKTVIAAAKGLLGNNGTDVTDATRTIEKNC